MIERRRYQVFLERQEPVVQLVRIQEVHHPVHVVPHILLLCHSLQRRRLVVHLSRHQMGHLTSRASPGLDASLLSRLSTPEGALLYQHSSSPKGLLGAQSSLPLCSSSVQTFVPRCFPRPHPDLVTLPVAYRLPGGKEPHPQVSPYCTALN